GARYSAKFFTTVVFSRRKLPIAESVLREGIIDISPLRLFAKYQCRVEQAAHDPVGHALPGIAGMNIDAFMTRIAADEAAIIDGIEYLTGPAMADLVKFWNQISGPCLQCFETDPRIIGFAGLVVGPAD